MWVILSAPWRPIAPVNCLAGDQSREPCCHRGEACRTRHVWEKLRDRINEVLDSVFLDELIESKPGSLVK